MTDIVRTEWGSTAIIITDIAINTAYQHIETALAAGGNMWATSGSSFYNWLVTAAPNDAAAVEKGHSLLGDCRLCGDCRAGCPGPGRHRLHGLWKRESEKD